MLVNLFLPRFDIIRSALRKPLGYQPGNLLLHLNEPLKLCYLLSVAFMHLPDDTTANAETG